MDFMFFEISDKGVIKFYFGINLHVVKGLIDKIIKFFMLRMNENVGVGLYFRFNDLDDRFIRFFFDNVENGVINVIF